MKPSCFKCGHGGLYVCYDHAFGLELTNLTRGWRHRIESAWAIIWYSYSTANFGLIYAAIKK
jgi:hypothetical protein